MLKSLILLKKSMVLIYVFGSSIFFGNFVLSPRMSVVGFDFGNESGVVVVARQRGIDVVLNDESKRETPAVVCFGEKQRFLGTAGAASSMMNPKNTISQIKRLIGRPFSDPELRLSI